MSNNKIKDLIDQVLVMDKFMKSEDNTILYSENECLYFRKNTYRIKLNFDIPYKLEMYFLSTIVSIFSLNENYLCNKFIEFINTPYENFNDFKDTKSEIFKYLKSKYDMTDNSQFYQKGELYIFHKDNIDIEFSLLKSGDINISVFVNCSIRLILSFKNEFNVYTDYLINFIDDAVSNYI
jgi:hypothetical protein